MNQLWRGCRIQAQPFLFVAPEYGSHALSGSIYYVLLFMLIWAKRGSAQLWRGCRISMRPKFWFFDNNLKLKIRPEIHMMETSMFLIDESHFLLTFVVDLKFEVIKMSDDQD